MSGTVIVIPCYNEAGRLRPEVFRSALQAFSELRLLFVDDGSTDDTSKVLEGLSREGLSVAVLSLPENVGKAESVRRGMLEAMGSDAEFLGYWDADLATPLSTLPEFEQVLREDPVLEIAMGARVQLLGRTIKRRPSRHYIGRIFATAASWILGLPVYDTQCGAKLFRASSRVRDLFSEPFRTRWTFDVEILARRCRERPEDVHSALYELPLTAWEDVGGSRLGLSAWWTVPRDLIRIYREYPELAKWRHEAGLRPSEDPAGSA